MAHALHYFQSLNAHHSHVIPQVDECDGILVVGTSLEVYSAYRFLNHASIRNNNSFNDFTGLTNEAISDSISNTLNKEFNYPIPIAICNIGQTRAERMKLTGIVFKSEANCANILKAATENL